MIWVVLWVYFREVARHQLAKQRTRHRINRIQLNLPFQKAPGQMVKTTVTISVLSFFANKFNNQAIMLIVTETAAIAAIKYIGKAYLLNATTENPSRLA